MTRRTLAIAAALLFTLTTVPPAAASEWYSEPVLAQQIPIDVLHPIAGSNYRIANQCANALDGQCIHLERNGWVRYAITIDGFGPNGIDYLTTFMRGQHWTLGCPWRLQGPGVDETREQCPANPNAAEEGGSFWFYNGYPPGTYTLDLICDANCNYVWVASLEIRSYYHGFRLGFFESDHEYFPEPGQIPGVPGAEFTHACVIAILEGSNWYPGFSYSIDWGDDSTESGSSAMARQWWDSQPRWGREFCHEYEFPVNVYQVCFSATDSYPRTVSHCITISGGINAEEFVNDGVEYVTGTVT